jgi:ABC-type branched-subunit amino acid transport system ATPase component
MRSLLEVQALTKHFGGLAAVRGVDFSVARGQIKALIGPNGAGKTTIFNCIAGVLAPTSGRVVFEGEPLPSARPHVVAARGIARTFQICRLFGDMTVLEHVLIGAHRHARAGWIAAALHTRAMQRDEARLRADALAVLERIGLASRADVAATALSYGEQRLLEVGRALAMAPKLLLLDEPGAGLNRDEQARLGALIRTIRDGGATILLVDHHMDFVMDLSDEVLVVSYGEKLAEGSPAVVRAHPDVVAAYLGADGA